MSSVDIKRGDAYFIKIILNINDEPLTADDLPLIHCVEFTLGTNDKKRKLYPDEIGFADGVFLYPLSQEETFAFKEGKTIPIDIRVHFENGNVVAIETRNSLSTGLSYFYDRCSKMAATTLYPTVTLMLIDSEGHVIKNEHMTTAYQPQEGE